MQTRRWTPLLFMTATLFAQENTPAPTAQQWTEVISRLEKLEAQNRQLTEEIHTLQSFLPAAPATSSGGTPSQPALEQRLDVAEQRIDEQAQTKVEASERFPIRVTGVLLFNAFANTGATTQGPYLPALSGPEQSGATVRQTLLGLDFHGPALPWGGKASGSLTLDLAGSSQSNYGGGLNIRRAVLDLDWSRRRIELGQDKPLISRRSPDSLAEVLVPPLAYSGNPWVWVPQVRYVENIGSPERTGLSIESSILETEEDLAYTPPVAGYYVQKARPALEERVAFWLHNGDNRRFEIAPGFHVSTSHVGGFSVPSQFATLDWLIRPSRFLQITGFAATGRNMANLGGFTNGFYSGPDHSWHAVRGAGGWTQVAIQVTPRLTWNSFAGLQAPRVYGLSYGSLSHDYSFASNVIFRFAPNVLLGAEALQERVGYVGQNHQIRNHYDLALGYLF